MDDAAFTNAIRVLMVSGDGGAAWDGSSPRWIFLVLPIVGSTLVINSSETLLIVTAT
jgi:hypothetical protein